MRLDDSLPGINVSLGGQINVSLSESNSPMMQYMMVQ